MKIPIFEEILLKGNSVNDLRSLIENSRIGKVPCYINLSTFSSDELEVTLINLEQTLLENSIHPRFPYPLYIISNKPINTIIPSVKSVAELPAHYFKKVKRPSNKELQLLNKLSLKVDKIKNLELYKISSELKDSTGTQRRLYAETKELYFLEVLNSQIIKKNKNKVK
jgi:hypothetical protein